ncbi:uncharacterized protein LOC142355418 isoform X2 [Convolutriloba macropyga]
MPNEQNSDFDENKVLISSQTARSRTKISAEGNGFLNSTTPPRSVMRSHSVSSDDEISPEIISNTSEKSSIIYQDFSTLATNKIEKSNVLLESHDDSYSISHSHLQNSGVIVLENSRQLEVQSQDLSPTSYEKLEEFPNLEDFETVRTSNVQCKIELSDNYKRKSILGFESENPSFDSNYLGDVSSVLFEDDERPETVPKAVPRLTRRYVKISRSVKEDSKRSLRKNARANVNDVNEERRVTRSAKSLGRKSEGSQEILFELKKFSNLVHDNERKTLFDRDPNNRYAKEKSAKLSRSDVEIESPVATVDDQSQQDKNLIIFDSSEQELNREETFDNSRTDEIVSESVNCTDDRKQSSEQFQQKEGGRDDNSNDKPIRYFEKYEAVSARTRSERVINERKYADSKIINQRTAQNSPKVSSRDSVITCGTTRSAVDKSSKKMENEALRISSGITKTRKSERDPEAAVDSSNFTEVQNKVPEGMITTDQGSLQELYQSTLDQNLEARLSIVGSKIREFVEAFQDINPGSDRTSKNGDDNDVGKIENRESVENLAESTNVIYQQPNKKEVEKLSGDQIFSGSNEESESRQSTREPFDSPRKSKISDQQSSKNLARRITYVNIGTTATVTFSKLKKQHLRNFAKTRQSVSLIPSQPTGRKSVQNEFENVVCAQFMESKNRKRVNFDVDETNEKMCLPNPERGGSGSGFSRVPKSLPERCFVENCEFTSIPGVRASERKAGKLKRMTLKRVTRATRGVSKAQEIENDHLGSDVDLQIQSEERTENCTLDRANSQENFPANPSQLYCDNSSELLTERERFEDVEVRRLSSIIASDGEGEQLQLCTEENLKSFHSGAHQFQWDQQVDKIGEGAFSEVFRVTLDNGERRVLKVVPVKSDIERANADNEYQITSALSKLSPNFVHLYEAAYLQGKYPEPLVDAWNGYQSLYPSQALNCSPEAFGSKTHFCVLSMEDAGTPLEHFRFARIDQVVSIVQQIACTLAVAEQQLQFEHRDLHMSNVLISQTRVKQFSYTLSSVGINGPGNGKAVKKKGPKNGADKKVDLNVNSRGLKATIIDYTLSRLTLDNQLKFNDLSGEENADLFEAAEVEGGIASSGGQVDEDQESVEKQFLVYRDMQRLTNNHWDRFVPETNVYWLHHLVDRLLYWKPKSHFSHYDPDRRARLKSVYRSDMCSDKYSSCAQLVTQSKLLKL